MIEDSPLRQLVHIFPLECYAVPELVLLLEDSVAHPFQLRPGEVPDLGHLSGVYIFLDGGEEVDLEAV